MTKFHFLVFAVVLIAACNIGDSTERIGDRHTKEVRESSGRPESESKPDEPLDLAVILGAEEVADTYSTSLPLTMNIQITSPKALKAVSKNEKLPSISLGSTDSPWWKGLVFDVQVDTNQQRVGCDVFPETTKDSIIFNENTYNTAVAVLQPDSSWRNKTIRITCSAEKNGKVYKSRPLTIDFSAPTPEEAEIDLAQFNLLLRYQEFDKARELADKYISSEPENAQGYSMMADLCEAQGDYESAIRAYRMEITLIGREENHDAVQFILQRIHQLQAKTQQHDN